MSTPITEANRCHWSHKTERMETDPEGHYVPYEVAEDLEEKVEILAGHLRTAIMWMPEAKRRGIVDLLIKIEREKL